MARKSPLDPVKRWIRFPRLFDWAWWFLTAPVHPVLAAVLLVTWLAVVGFLVVTIIRS